MLTIVEDNSKKQCLLIIDNKLLLGTGVECLLLDGAALTVATTTSPDGATLLEIVEYLQPDVIILEESYFLGLALSFLVELLTYPQLWIITVSANDGRVQMCYEHQLRTTNMAGLFLFIRGSQKVVTRHTIPTNASPPELQ
jgi:chemotaxis response regulator CheB